MQNLNGSLVNVSVINPNSQEKFRFFEPTNIQDQRSDSPRRPDVYYRYLEATKGIPYGITIKLKDTTKQYSIGIAIDGRGVLEGKKIPDFIEDLAAWTGESYIFNCGQENGGTLLGWRESQENVRQFFFSKPEKSLAGKWEDYSAMGTIVIAVFRHRDDNDEVIPPQPQFTPGTRGLGTGFGQRVRQKVDYTHFEPKRIAYEIFVIKYEDRQTLQKLGIWKPETKEGENRFWPEEQKREFIEFPE
ncbi:MAG: hypothetical protein U5L10_05235 [Candidatus Moranbacteria bacterium]|nr:hypothetical protein [Candidatus Moranbacteria bacterium]